jgi:hypothetical protein
MMLINTFSILTLYLFTMVIAGSSYGQTTTNSETNSYLDCYTKAAAVFHIANMFSPYAFDLTDPKMKKLISAACNFYYQKSGIWIDISKDTHITEKYGQEFWNQYPKNEMPPGVMEFWNDMQK